MADLASHCRTVLSAIYAPPGRRDLLDRACQLLTEEHFPDTVLQRMWTMTVRFADATGQVMSRSAMHDMMRGRADAGTIALYEEMYDALALANAGEAEFAWSLIQVRDLTAERDTSEMLTRSMEIFRLGWTDTQGKTWRGHDDARQWLSTRMGDIDRGLMTQASPEGDMRLETDEMLAEYASRKRSRTTGEQVGILFGVPELDGRIGGLQPGELDLLLGYTSCGKTSLAVQLSWSAAVEQGRNVVILTTETLRPQVRRKLLARHSRLPVFGLAEGLNTRDLKNGTVPEELEPALHAVINDFGRNPNYGRCYIAQVPRGATLAACEQRLYRIQRQFNIDLVVIDYLRLLRSERKRQSDREELGAIVVDAKQLATTFDNGRGVPVVSPWQVNRASAEMAQKLGFYTTASTAETAETSNTADLIVSLLAPLEVENRYVDVRVGVPKNRDGERGPSFSVSVDYATSTFGVSRGPEQRDLASALAEEDFLNI